MLVTIKYFGMLLELTSKTTETININNNTSISQIETILLKKYPNIKNVPYNIALNLKIQNKSTLLNNGDELAFLPPFAGG